MGVDITINETIDLVDITVNPNIIEVNVTRTSGGGGNQTLQEVTDEGATTDNTITVSDGTNETSIQIGQVQILDGLGSYAQIAAQGAGFVNGDGTGTDQCSVGLAASWGDQITGLYLTTQDGTNTAALEIKLPPEYYTDLPVENIISNYFIPFKPSGDYTLATLDDITGGGTVTSVGLTMPSAFTVTNSPITSSGDIAVTGAGAVSQYVRGDGTLANFPTSSGGGSSLSFYLNGAVSQGTFGGVAFREMDRTPILGAGTDFTINANGYIQSFITDAGVPNQLEIPAGNWNFETYFSASSGGGSPSFYVELYKWDGATLSLIASSSANPEFITGGTSTDLYITALAVPQTTLLATDRLAVRIWVNNSGRTIKLHTEDSNLCQVITTFSTGLTALNGLTAQVQNLATGISGTDFGIVSSGSAHTFNLPNASAANRGLLTSADWTSFNSKASTAYADAKVTDAIVNGVTTVAPSQNAVFDALALKTNNTDWIDYSNISTIVGFSSFTVKLIFYKIIDDIMFVNFSLQGTSNSTALTFTLPNSAVNGLISVNTYIVNNGTASTGAGRIIVSGNTVTCTINGRGDAYTASNGKASVGEFFIQI